MTKYREYDTEYEANTETTAITDLDERVRQLEARLDRLDETEVTESNSATPAPGKRRDVATHSDEYRHETDAPHANAEATADDVDSHTKREAVEAVLNDWRPGQNREKRERQRDIGRAVIAWLRDQEVASASEFKAELEPEYPVEGQSPPTWWRKTAREALSRTQDAGLVTFVDGRKEWRWTG